MNLILKRERVVIIVQTAEWGGTGVVTIGAVLATAAQIDGKGSGVLDNWQLRYSKRLAPAIK